MLTLRRRLLALVLGIAVFVATAFTAYAASDTPVLTTTAKEQQPAAAPGYLTWNQNSTAKPEHFNTFARPDSDPTIRVNPPGTVGYGSGITGNTLVYQQVIGPSSDLVMDNLTNGHQSDPPAGVNTKFWEWRPSISGDWLLFTRRNFNPRHRLDTVVLFNLNTNETRTLATSTNPKHYLASGQVSGNYAVWTYCAANCNVYLYDIAAHSTQQIPLAAAAQFDPAVTADGTMYFTRAGVYCGQDETIVRRDFTGTETAIDVLPSGKDAWYDSATTNLDGSDTVYFGRVSCKRGFPSDIYRIDGADTAIRVQAPADGRRADDSGRIPRTLAGPDAGP